MNPETNMLDENQYNLVNVNLGLNTYGYLDQYGKVNTILNDKKLLRKKLQRCTLKNDLKGAENYKKQIAVKQEKLLA
jgi:hypothetical protein